MPVIERFLFALQEQLDQRLQQRQARETGICPIREELYSQCFGACFPQRDLRVFGGRFSSFRCWYSVDRNGLCVGPGVAACHVLHPYPGHRLRDHASCVWELSDGSWAPLYFVADRSRAAQTS